MDRQTTLCWREMLSRVQAPSTRDRHQGESSEERSGPRCQKWCICLYLSEDWGARVSDSQAEGRERGGNRMCGHQYTLWCKLTSSLGERFWQWEVCYLGTLIKSKQKTAQYLWSGETCCCFSKLYMSVKNSCVSRGLYKTSREIWVAQEEPLRSALGRAICGKLGVCEWSSGGKLHFKWHGSEKGSLRRW